MYMTPQEAEDIMSPFYPHDPNLAMRAIDQALGGNVPEWILEAVVGSYFTFLQVKEMHEKIEQKINSLADPFGLGTIPYTFDMDTDQISSN